MPYIFVGFDICHQSHSRRCQALLTLELWETHIKSRAILQCLTRWHGALWMWKIGGYSNI